MRERLKALCVLNECSIISDFNVLGDTIILAHKATAGLKGECYNTARICEGEAQA